MSIQDVKLNVMRCVMESTVPATYMCDDGTYRVNDSNVIYADEQSATKAAESKQLLNILVSMVEGLELNWGYNGKSIEITLPSDKRRGNCNLCKNVKTMMFVPREEPCKSCYSVDGRPNWSIESNNGGNQTPAYNLHRGHKQNIL